MRTTSLIWIVVSLIVIGAAAWYLWGSGAGNDMAINSATTTPSGAAGINGSPNQGNLGQPDNGSGQVQQPQTGSDGSDITQNLTLGLDLGGSAGAHLIGWTGMTVYTYDKDSTGTTTCYAKCAQNWPPYIVPAGMHLNLQSGVSSSAAGTITRADGTSQLTYGGKPLYFYVGDTSGSDVSGNGVGGVWHVVKP